MKVRSSQKQIFTKKEWIRGRTHTPSNISQENGVETRRDIQHLDTKSRPIPARGKVKNKRCPRFRREGELVDRRHRTMDNKNTNKATKGIMEWAAQRPANASQVGTEEKSDDGWGRIRGEDSTACPFKTKGSWEFARRTLSCSNPVDPLRPLVEMAAEKVAEYLPTEEDRKFAPDDIALINKTGIKRRHTKGLDITNPSGLA